MVLLNHLCVITMSEHAAIPCLHSYSGVHAPGLSCTCILSLTLFCLFLPPPLSDPEADQEASEMLTDNAHNLMSAVSEVLYATEAATIRVPPEARKELRLQWVSLQT